MARTPPTDDRLPRWAIEGILHRSDERGIAQAMEEVMSGMDRLRARYDQEGISATAARLPAAAAARTAAQVIDATNELHDVVRPLAAYLHARITSDATDDVATAESSRLQTKLTALAALAARWEGWVAVQDASVLVEGSDTAAAHGFALERAAHSARFRMTDDEEDLAAALRPTGSAAWAKLHRDVTSRLSVVVDTGDGDGASSIPMSAARGLATHPDGAVRRRAHEAELAGWHAAEVPLAAALNGAIGERVVVNRRRGWSTDLAAALFANNVDHATLDAMHAAVDDALPWFRRYLRAKARLIQPDGEPDAPLAWWDLLAPVATSAGAAAVPMRIPWTEAVERVREAFRSYDPSLVALVDRAVAEQWIDAEPRPGKVDGAFCLPVRPGASRILLNYDGSPKSVQTLAHELGHAFHGVQLAERTPWQRTTPMALAETASIFCETLMVEAMLASVDPVDVGAKLAILDTDLQGACQVVVDIRSRFLFEEELCARRTERALSPTELCELMVAGQRRAYGDGLRDDTLHPYMWAVKGHYFTPFYNWPYTFGLLFGLGLYESYRVDPDRFRSGYHDMLSRTGMADATALAQSFAIDVRARPFWDASLAVLRHRIDDYEAICAGVTGAGPAPAAP